MPHIPEEELAIYAFHASSLAPDRRTTIEREIAACTDCRTTLDFMTVSDAEFADPDVWEPLTGSATMDSLHAFGARIAAEDEEADQLLAPLLEAPAMTAWTTLPAKRRFVTGGVARKLTAHAQGLCRREPLDALTFADAAVSVAEALHDETYTARAVYEIRGSAWRARANALNFLGRFDEALDSCRRAERAYRKLRTPGLGLASVSYVRGCILYGQQKFDDASAAAEISERGFAHLGHDERQMWAVNLRANIAFERQQIETAISLFQRVYDYGDSLSDMAWIARGAHALGTCFLEKGNIGEASMNFHVALKIFRELDERTEVTRAEWGVARVFVEGGKLHEGIARLRGVVIAFARAGMVTDSALTGLDLAEALVAIGKTREIGALATHLFEVFMGAGMLTGALSAIAFLKEGAADGTLTKTDIEVVRVFLRRVEHQPDLVFLPPPRTPS